MTGQENLAIRMALPEQASQEYLHHSSAQRVNTDVYISSALKKQYPELKLTVTPVFNVNLLAFAGAGHADAVPLTETDCWLWREYIPPARRLDGNDGYLGNSVKFGKYNYTWGEKSYILYVVDGRDGGEGYPQIVNQYILSVSEPDTDKLLFAAGKYGSQLHNEVWVFDGGYWQKSAELWDSVQKSNWEDVILDEDMKESIIHDVENFFDSRETYEKLKVPWKRGIIYHGPPGNGKTISIKAMMHALYERENSVPTLYVRSLSSFAGPEYSLNQIFSKARQTAPCYLVFEDLDSIVNDSVRSYFLNEVDGLKRNDGILMVGSTNHLDRLDPGISKRPSRFDRKYYFPDPSFDQRVAYSKFWQEKLSENDDIKFPDKLCAAIAGITKGFSFAYIQEAFVASLLVIAVSKKSLKEGDDKDDLEKYILWREIKKQVKILRDEMDSEGTSEGGRLP